MGSPPPKCTTASVTTREGSCASRSSGWRRFTWRGAARTFRVELWTDHPGHLLGTARMGADPERSVVDSFGRAHDVPNLFIADGSIFVTSGRAIPRARSRRSRCASDATSPIPPKAGGRWHERGRSARIGSPSRQAPSHTHRCRARRLDISHRRRSLPSKVGIESVPAGKANS